jgi:hypothetical protein
MAIGIDLLRKLDFQPTNIRIECRNGELTYVTKTAEDIGRQSQSGVYVIIDRHDTDTASVVYVGKAGRGPNKRLREHAGGYRDNRNTGKHALQNRMQADAEGGDLDYQVWFRPSRRLSVEDILAVELPGTIPEVSQYSLEEEALISYFDQLGEDLINKA